MHSALIYPLPPPSLPQGKVLLTAKPLPFAAAPQPPPLLCLPSNLGPSQASSSLFSSPQGLCTSCLSLPLPSFVPLAGTLSYIPMGGLGI